MQTSTGKRLASALGAALSVATLTAFAVAPLTEEPLPPSLRIIEPVRLTPTPLVVDGHFLRQASVSRGETLGSLLRKLGDPDRDLIDFVRSDPVARRMLKLAPGTTVRAEVDADERIRSLSYPLGGAPDAGETPLKLDLQRVDGQWTARIDRMILERTLVTRTATITSSLYAAADQAGIPDALTARIPEIFASDMDFHRDVRKGDRLRIVYELFTDPRTLAEGLPGRILAVEYQAEQRRLEALWFERADGSGDYYNADGRTLRKTFLRSPMEFTRISSGFTLVRRHPVFRDWRAHKGVDYAAPSGTRIRAIGEGVVEFAGVQRGYGKVVIIKHDKERSTLYAHMRGFTRGVTEGAKIEQGQVIGYVGQTGWASGPHLHFELLVNGEPFDPAAVLPPEEPPMDVETRLRFRAAAQDLMARMRWDNSAQVALFE